MRKDGWLLDQFRPEKYTPYTMLPSATPLRMKREIFGLEARAREICRLIKQLSNHQDSMLDKMPKHLVFLFKVGNTHA